MVGWRGAKNTTLVMIGTAGRRDVRKADKPFCFTGSSELRESLGEEAEDEKRLVELLEEVPQLHLLSYTHLIPATQSRRTAVSKRLCPVGGDGSS
jgi:hypothetical protein